MRYVVFSGHPKNNETSQIEVIDDHGSIHICQSNSRYPLNVNNARSVFTNDRMIVCGGRIKRIPQVILWAFMAKLAHGIHNMTASRLTNSKRTS